MNNYYRISLTLLLCGTIGSATACDGGDESVDFAAHARVQAIELGLIGPMPATSSGEAQLGEIAAPALADAEPMTTGYPAPRIAPSKRLMIGWQRWAMGLPWENGPITDETGDHCGDGQSGPVWYLAGTGEGPATRDCTIPTGKQLFFPLINLWAAFPPEFVPPEEIPDWLPDMEEYFDDWQAATCSLTLRLNGQDLLDFDSMKAALYVRESEPFDVDIHDEHWATPHWEGGIIPMIGHGFYARLQPLPPGDYVLEFGGAQCDDFEFSTSVTYHLHVQ